MALNSLQEHEVGNISLGQAGAYLCTDTSNPHTAPTGSVFIAFQCLTDVTFDSDANGLVAENTYFYSSNAAATSINENNGANASSITFPKGMTIYGRWTAFGLNSGTVIAYLGT